MKSQNPTNFYLGAKVQASYTPTGVPDYDGNPLIEALPQIMSAKHAVQRLRHFPLYDNSMRLLDNSIRYHLLRTSSRFFTPLGIHIDLERRISCAVRMSLIQRNPVKKNYLIDIENKVDKFTNGWVDKYSLQDDYISTYAPGFNFVGISGQGKSQTIIRILKNLPQVIFHSNYKERELIETQLVWLKLDCPFDGSTKGLCLNFFQAVDSILGTNYLKTHGRGKTATQMLPLIASVAANHHLGILVIDEIQRLNQAASGGKEEMLNFFVQLVNILGIAVILVGTFQAMDLLNGTFSQMRRGTGQGDIVWDRMSFDRNWDSFVNSLWKSQFTQKETILKDNPDLSKVLYDECQGITDLAIKAYMFAQERAIETKEEEITPAIIRSATRDKFQIIRPAIEAFRNKKKEAVKVFEGAYPEFLEKYMEGYSSWSKSSSQLNSPPPIILTGEIVNEPEIKAVINQHNKATDKKDHSLTKRKKKQKPKAKGVLPELSEKATESGKQPIFEALTDLGYTSFSENLGFNDIQPTTEGDQK